MCSCIFCNKSSDGKAPEEHIWPESLGSTKLITPDGTVCGSCNNYFSREIEKFALESFPFKFIRSFFGIPTKKNKFSKSKTTFGEIYGKPGGKFIYSNSKELNEKGKLGEIDTFQLKISTKCENPNSVCRLLLKMALEWITKENLSEAYSEKYNSAKQFVRFPKKGSQWTFAIDFKNEFLFDSLVKGIHSSKDLKVNMEIVNSDDGILFILTILGLQLITPLIEHIVGFDSEKPDFHIYRVKI